MRKKIKTSTLKHFISRFLKMLIPYTWLIIPNPELVKYLIPGLVKYLIWLQNHILDGSFTPPSTMSKLIPSPSFLFVQFPLSSIFLLLLLLVHLYTISLISLHPPPLYNIIDFLPSSSFIKYHCFPFILLLFTVSLISSHPPPLYNIIDFLPSSFIQNHWFPSILLLYTISLVS